MQSQKQKYTEASLAAALRDIRNESISIRAASRQYGVPVTTLHDRIKGRTIDELKKPGPGTVLTKTEESKIVEWLINIAKCGFPQKSSELLDVVQKIIKDEKRKTPFKNDRPGKKWYYNFMKRHSELLSLRAPETVSKARAVIKEESIRIWFRDLEAHLLEENCRDILDDPTRIFNGDETSFSLAPKTGNVIGPKGYHNIYQVKFANEKDNLTVLLVFSASAETLPPVIVFPYQKVPFKIVSNMPEDWVVGRSDTGWMRTETFYEYIANDFSNWLDQHQIQRPILLLVDGHKSHISMHISNFCSSNQIILYSLPPNTTHIMQPADVGAFKGLKSDYRKTVRDWSNLPENYGKTVTKTNFSQLLKQVLDKSDRSLIIQNAFKKCGIFPFDPNSVDYTKCIQNNLINLNSALENEPTITIEEVDVTKKVLFSIENELKENGIDFEKLLKIVTGTQIKLQSTQAPQPLQLEDSFLTSLQADQILEKAAIAISQTDRILEESIISDIEIFDDFNARSPLIRGSKDGIVDDEILEEAMENILNYDVQNCETSSKENKASCTSSTTLVCTDLAENAPETTALVLTCKTNTPASSPSSGFDSHLKYPDPIRNKKGKTLFPQARAPMSISSKKWKEFYINQERIKEERRKEINNRKRLRQIQRNDNQIKKKTRKMKISDQSRKKEICGQCEDELDTDTEDDGLKNIGCDLCSRWYHLSCTKLCAKTFEEAKKEDFVCDFCA